MFFYGGYGNWYRRGIWINNEELERNEVWSGFFIVIEDEIIKDEEKGIIMNWN